MKIEIVLILVWSSFAANTPRTGKSISGQWYFPRIVWSYWHQGFENASTFTKLCLNNQRHYAEASGWTYNLLTKDNIHEFLDYQRIQQLWKMNGFMIPQVGADIVRMSLLLKYGGMWMDANSFFIEKLDWVNDIKNQPHFYNKVGDQPDVILGSYTSGFIESPTINQGQTYLFPNLEDWFMIAVPNSSFFQEVLKTIEKVVSIGRLAANQYYGSLGVNNPFSHSDYFLMSNYIFQIIIQLKEIELRNSSLTGSSDHAINYYKIWNMEAYKTSFVFLSVYDYKINLLIEDIIQYNISMYRQRIGGFRFFVKFNGAFYHKLNQILDNFQENYCLGLINTIQKGSILSQFLLDLIQHSSPQMIKYSLMNVSELDCASTIGKDAVQYSSYYLAFTTIIIMYFIFNYLISRKINN